MKITEIMELASAIPVLEVSALAQAAPLARALSAGGLRVIELTLRTDCALDALREMKMAAPDLIIGMGTVRTREDVRLSSDAGAAFLVSPGASPGLLTEMAQSNVPSLPGVATASEAIIASEAGFKALKFFPAEPAGGISYLNAMSGPLPEISFCPTGGVSADKAPEYLSLPNVACVGGSWIATKKMIAEGAWDVVTENARRAAALVVARD